MAENLDSYLCFCVSGVYYIVPVMEVERICLRSDIGQEDVKWVRLDIRQQENVKRAQSDRSCVVVLQEGGCRYAVETTLVYGVLQIAPADQYELPEVLQGQYPWLLGTAVWQEEQKLLLLLNGHRLEYLIEEDSPGKPVEEAESDRSAEEDSPGEPVEEAEPDRSAEEDEPGGTAEEAASDRSAEAGKPGGTDGGDE